MQSLSTALTCPANPRANNWKLSSISFGNFGNFHHTPWTTPFHTSWASQCQCPLASVRAHHWHRRQSLQWFRQSASVSCCILLHSGAYQGTYGVLWRQFSWRLATLDWQKSGAAKMLHDPYQAVVKSWSGRCKEPVMDGVMKAQKDEMIWNACNLYIVLRCFTTYSSWSSALACEIPGCQASFVCVWVRCEKRQRPQYLAQRQCAAKPFQLSQANKSLSRKGTTNSQTHYKLPI